MFGLERLSLPAFGAGKNRWQRVCATLEAEESVFMPAMGASSAQFKRTVLSNRIELLIKLSIYVLPRLSLQATTAIERNVAVKFGESLQIQRTLVAATQKNLPLSKILRDFDFNAPNSHDEAVKIFTNLCDIIGQSAQGGRVVRGRLMAVSSRLGLSNERASAMIKSCRI